MMYGTDAYLCKLFAGQLPVGLGPSHFARVPIHLEVLVAFRAAEIEDLQDAHLLTICWDLLVASLFMSHCKHAYRAVIPDEGDAVARIDSARAEPALL